MSAIPTTRRGVLFRSRLEARWAAMFDLLGWRWEYEPIDLAGYIPDFILVFPAGPVLVEVKPEFTIRDLEHAAAAKIERSGWETRNANTSLIVGATTAPLGHWGEAAGAISQSVDGLPLRDAAPWHRCLACKRPSVHHASAGWYCTVCGAIDGDGLLGRAPDVDPMWCQAGTAVRWRGAAA